MATLATFLRRSDVFLCTDPLRPAQTVRTKQSTVRAARAEADPYLLRALPNDDVFFFCKKIDNSRVARQADPRARGECWSAIGAACVLAAVLGSVLVPGVGGILAGRKLQALRQEEHRLVDERRVLDVEEARLTNAERLKQLAADHNLVRASPDQIIHLDGAGDGSLASNTQRH